MHRQIRQRRPVLRDEVGERTIFSRTDEDLTKTTQQRMEGYVRQAAQVKRRVLSAPAAR